MSLKAAPGGTQGLTPEQNTENDAGDENEDDSAAEPGESDNNSADEENPAKETENETDNSSKNKSENPYEKLIREKQSETIHTKAGEDGTTSDSDNWDIFYDKDKNVYCLTYIIDEGAEGDQTVDLELALVKLHAYSEAAYIGYENRKLALEDFLEDVKNGCEGEPIEYLIARGLDPEDEYVQEYADYIYYNENPDEDYFISQLEIYVKPNNYPDKQILVVVKKDITFEELYSQIQENFKSIQEFKTISNISITNFYKDFNTS